MSQASSPSLRSTTEIILFKIVNKIKHNLSFLRIFKETKNSKDKIEQKNCNKIWKADCHTSTTKKIVKMNKIKVPNTKNS